MTIRADLIERLRQLDFPTPTKVFLRDLINSVLTTEEAAQTGTDVAFGKVTTSEVLLSDTAWDDLRFPAQGINPAGSAAPPSVNTTDGTLEFSASATNVIAGIAQMPHSWKTGTSIEAHIHWSPTNTNTGNVYWRFEYEIQPINGVFTGFTTANTLDAAIGVADTHQIHGLASIDASAITTVSAIIKWKLSRIGGDATDTYNAVAKLLELDFHYQIDGFGSQEEFSKSI
jgi:hypothetical protein